MNERFYNAVAAALEEAPSRSAWDRGVKLYAEDLWSGMRDCLWSVSTLMRPGLLHEALLNGARDWYDYSYGGCALIYDRDIASRLCTRTWFLQTDGGRRAPNKRETWLDVQGRALSQAAVLIYNACLENMMGGYDND